MFSNDQLQIINGAVSEWEMTLFVLFNDNQFLRISPGKKCKAVTDPKLRVSQSQDSKKRSPEDHKVGFFSMRPQQKARMCFYIAAVTYFWCPSSLLYLPPYPVQHLHSNIILTPKAYFIVILRRFLHQLASTLRIHSSHYHATWSPARPFHAFFTSVLVSSFGDHCRILPTCARHRYSLIWMGRGWQ